MKTLTICPCCSKQSLSLLKMFVWFKSICSSCGSLIGIQNSVGMKSFFIYGLALAFLLHFNLKNDYYRLLAFHIGGLVATFAYVRYGDLKHIKE